MTGDLRKLAKNSFWVLLANLLVAGLNFVFIYFILRFLGLYEFGVYTLLLTTVGFAEQFTTLGLYPLMVSELARSIGEDAPGKSKSLLFRFSQAQILVSALGTGVFLLIAYLNIFHLSADNTAALYLLGLTLGLTGIQNIFHIAYEGFQRFDLQSLVTVTEAVFKILLLGLLLYWDFQQSVSNVVLILLISQLFSLLIGLPFFWGLIRGWIKIPRQKTNLFSVLLQQQGIYAFFTHQLKNIQLNLYPWIVKFFLGVEAVGIFSVLQKIQTALMKPVAPLDSTLLPMLSSMQHTSDVKAFYGRISKYSLWIGVAIIAPFLVAVPFLLKYYVGQSYPGQELAMELLLLTLPFYALSFPLRSILFRYREQAMITRITLATSLILFVSTAVFVSFFGLVGASLAMLLFYISDVFLRRPFVRRKYGIDFRVDMFFAYDSQDKEILRRFKSRLKGLLVQKTGSLP